MKKLTVFTLIAAIILCTASCVAASESNDSSALPATAESGGEQSTDATVSGDGSAEASADDDGYVSAGTIKIRCFKVGKADATLIRTQNSVVLIDTASDDKGMDIVEYLQEKGISKIDYMIISHFDKSEVGGADTVFRLAEVGAVIQPSYVKDSSQYREYLNALETSGAEVVTLTEAMSLELDGATFYIYPANESVYAEDDDNDFSIGVTVVHGENTLLFPGDAMSARMKEIIEYNESVLGISAFTYLKVPCNGVYCEGGYGVSSEEFFNWAQPLYASISCSEKNPAEDRVVTLLESAGAKVFFTKDGNIKMTSDGESFEVVQN